MAVSKIDIFNMALTALGSKHVTSETDGPSASRLNANWELARQWTIRDHPWNFTIARATLSPDVETPAFGYEYQYTLPGDFLRMDEVAESSDTDFRIEGNKLLCDESTVNIRYGRDVTNPGLFDPMCAAAIALKLAWICCYAITNNATLKAALMEEYSRVLSGAKAVDGQESMDTVLFTDEWLESRS